MWGSGKFEMANLCLIQVPIIETKKDLKVFFVSMVGVLGLEPRTLRV